MHAGTRRSRRSAGRRSPAGPYPGRSSRAVSYGSSGNGFLPQQIGPAAQIQRPVAVRGSREPARLLHPDSWTAAPALVVPPRFFTAGSGEGVDAETLDGAGAVSLICFRLATASSKSSPSARLPNGEPSIDRPKWSTSWSRRAAGCTGQAASARRSRTTNSDLPRSARAAH
jgi:hypothetical protein